MPVSVFSLFLSFAEKEYQTESNWAENLWWSLMDQKKPPKQKSWARRATRPPQGWRARPTPLGAPSDLVVDSWPPWCETDAKNSYKYRNPRKEIEIGSSAAANLCSHQKPIETLFRHPAGGGNHHRWPSSSSRRSPRRGGSSSPSGLRVCTSSYVFDLSLSLSCSWFGTILMYRELYYYSWILWCFSPSTLLWWIEFSSWSYLIGLIL